MAFRQYTECVKPGNFVDFSFNAIGIRNILIVFLSGGFGVWLIAIFAGGPVGLMVGVALFTMIVAYLYWWLHGRLICHNEQPCLLGVVQSLSAADPLQKAGDDDFSMNVLLAPGPTGSIEFFKQHNLPAPPVSAYQNTLQGRLVSPQQPILDVGRTYVSDEGHLKYITGLHCEFEGSGIHNLLIWAGVVLGLLVAALALTLFAPGLSQLITVLILLAIVFGGTGLLTGPFAGPGAAGAGDPTNVDESLKDLVDGDIVVVKGEWVYDSLHGGWNEIHPIRACVRIGQAIAFGDPWPPGLTTDAEVQTALGRWCAMLEDADDTEDGGSRDNPENDWVIHPLVDGCGGPIIL